MALSRDCFLLSHLLLKAGMRVIMEDPRYPGAVNAWNHAGATIVQAGVDEEGIRLPEKNASQVSWIYETPLASIPDRRLHVAEAQACSR